MTTPDDHDRGDYVLRVGEVDAVPISLVRSPQWSVNALIHAAAVGPCPGEEPVKEARAVAKVLQPRARDALAPLASDRGFFLDCVAPIRPIHDVTVAEQIEAIRNLPEDTLSRELVNRYGDEIPPMWWPALDVPCRWYSAMADAAQDSWKVLRHIWQDNELALARETRRVGEAAVRHGTGDLLNNLHPRLRYQDGAIRLRTRCAQPAEYDIGERHISLVPMVAAPDVLLVDFEGPDVVVIGYPLPGARTGAADPAETVDDVPLDLVLGRLRARTLRAINRPVTAGWLARSTQSAPNTVTYHCDQLQAAGLIVRERRGNQMWIRRTARGEELLDALSAPAS